MSHIADQLAQIRNRIHTACIRCGRDSGSVDLVAVSKTFPAAAILEAYRGGQRGFGESRLQEAMPKIQQLPSDILWHFIGRVQRNKLRKILESFDFIHGIDSIELAGQTDRIASELGIVPKIFLQINIAGEETKAGFNPGELDRSIKRIIELQHVDLVGLMAIPPPASSPEQARHWFGEMARLRDHLEAGHRIRLPHLSMGMSDDFEAAIAEGSTIVRIGSAIFGNR